jgi:hypothetical protein
MKTRFLKIITAVFAFIFIAFSELSAQPLLDLETGVVFSGYNDVRIPGDQGTLFSFSRELETSPKVFYRLRGSYTFGTRHNISLLFAPLTVNSEGMLSRNLIFEGVEFPSATPLEGSYKFNSYRITYRYDIVEKPRFEFGLGFTAKIRDARIAMTSASQKSEKTNVGFVPILNIRLDWMITDKLSLFLDGDALAAPQGRAEDIFIGTKYRVSDKIGLKAGYRILEGGADNDEVYNFALFHYATAGILLYL